MSSGISGYGKRNKHSFSGATELALVKSGDDFFKRAVEIIARSKKTIHFQTYIFIGDSTGKIIIDALTNAVKRGVEVFLLVDAFGSNDLANYTIEMMTKNGIQFRKYSPLFYKYRMRFGRRLHHKIILGDETEALIGGINVEDKYRVAGPETPWLDYAVYIKGEVCNEIKPICESLWKGKGYRIKRKKLLNSLSPATLNSDVIPVRLSQNDWLRRKNNISKGIRNAVGHSHLSVTLVASYFLPGGKARRILKKASQRNVSVKIILPGISDVTLAKKATMYLYGWMFRNKLEIYEWNDTILHGKINLVDDKWASIGSYNINHLSHYSSIETNIEVFDAAFCQVVKTELDAVIAKCHRVTYFEYLQKMNVWQKFICWCAFSFTRFLFWLEFLVLSKE
ncbi:MAG TPA: phospholipase D-like domain-containing protein [Bacteroidia bacterium]|nr:phospholipase D-like domain-containing protein [Bacteroidia bacterium]